ncbi:MAG: 23S rRNA (uracil(1939)-C(5))-methyltransferase RlmD [Endomicrobiales bacterium]|nr:23S rRNA (uracil(1939)-C(5))-methyltransferase RlmD [Endomicrobiales bacterium]
MIKKFKAKVEKLIFGGQGFAHIDGKAAFIWNALPGEEVEFCATRVKRDFIEGVTETVIVPSPHRIEQVEEHFTSCSPWQVLEFSQENYWKQAIARETFEKLSAIKLNELPQIESNPNEQYGYRNKIEYSFTVNESGGVSFAFFGRASHRKRPIKNCLLATESINKSASILLDWLNQQKAPLAILKTLILRSSRNGQVCAALFVKHEFEFSNYPQLSNELCAFSIHLSNPLSPASVSDAVLYSSGNDLLKENICGRQLNFSSDSFFQINPSLFEVALKDIEKFAGKTKDAVDYYSGVGAIGLLLSQYFQNIKLVDSCQSAIENAKENIKLNNIKNCEAFALPSEKIIELITPDKTIIFDPPRSGLHPKVVEKTIEQKPQMIIYLSCNLSTQARDISLLKEFYDLKFIKLYNFFPRTPHFESLCVLDVKQ